MLNKLYPIILRSFFSRRKRSKHIN